MTFPSSPITILTSSKNTPLTKSGADVSSIINGLTSALGTIPGLSGVHINTLISQATSAVDIVASSSLLTRPNIPIGGVPTAAPSNQISNSNGAGNLLSTGLSIASGLEGILPASVFGADTILTTALGLENTAASALPTPGLAISGIVPTLVGVLSLVCMISEFPTPKPQQLDYTVSVY
jgi:hypothetical protein